MEIAESKPLWPFVDCVANPRLRIWRQLTGKVGTATLVIKDLQVCPLQECHQVGLAELPDMLLWQEGIPAVTL